MTVTEDNIITWRIHPNDMSLIVRMAKAACIGGQSQIRNGQERQDALTEDQIVGQIGQYVGSMWLFGTANEYKRARWIANQNPTSGDGGSDLLGANIDFKASRVRHRGKDLLSYRLPVRPKERHVGWVYVLILVTHMARGEPVIAKMIGWAMESMLPQQPEMEGVFRGAYTIPARELHPIPPIHWMWTKV
jgi:hypothetical protein